MNYGHLYGKEILWSNEKGGFTEPTLAMVVAVDYDLGITIVDAEDHQQYKTCIIGPESSLSKSKPASCYERWDVGFAAAVAVIESGYYEVDAIDRAFYKEEENPWVGKQPSAQTCPFGQ